MKVIVSAAVSADGYLDDLSGERLVLSSPEDWAEVHALRARCDAILVGAGTLRRDNPSLVLRDGQLRRERTEQGRNPDLIKVTLSDSGTLSPQLRFFTEGTGEKIVFVPEEAAQRQESLLEDLSRNSILSPEKGEALPRNSGSATVVSLPEVTARTIVAELARRGVKTLMVEGGSHILNLFFSEDAVDEFRLAVAPFFVGEPGAPRLTTGGKFPFDKACRMELADLHRAGDMAVMYYVLKRE